MGLESIVANALIRVKADTSQAKAEIRTLRGVEAQAARERLTEMESTNRGIDKQIAMWGKIAVGVGAGVAAYKMAQAAARAYLEDVRLESAAAGANINALRQATLGLIETDDLLRFAGKAQAGVWKLNQREMETVLRGATALRKTMGVELKPTIDSLTEALAKGSTRALKEFGIEAKDKAGALRQLDDMFKSLGGNVKMAGDEMQASGVQIADAFDDLQGELGKFVMTLEPAAQALAKFVGWLARASEFTDYLTGADTQGGPKEDQLRRQAAKLRKQAAGHRSNSLPTFDNWILSELFGATNTSGLAMIGKGKSRASAAGVLEAEAAELELQAAAIIGRKGFQRFAESLYESTGGNLLAGLRRVPGSKPGKPGKGGGSDQDVAGAPIGWDFNFREMFGGAASGLYGAGKSVYGELGAQGKQRDHDVAEATIMGRDIAEKARADVKDRKGRTYLETVFGTPAEINEMAETLKAAQTVFDGFTEAVVAGFDAWITGQSSMVAAFNEAIVEMMRSLAKQMAVEALKHGAFGLGALAIGGPLMAKTASEHFAAAAAFGGVALAAGTLAKAGGGATGQWSRGGSSGGGGSAARTISDRAGGGDDSNRPIIVYVGAEWAAMSKIEQAAGIQRAIRHGKRGSRHIRRS